MAKRGRKAKEPSPADREKIKDFLESGGAIAAGAKLLGITTPTFRKHFRKEILSGKKIAAAARKQPKAPARKVTAKMREDVERHIGCRMSPRQSAYALGFRTDAEVEEFKEIFALEIQIGHAVSRAKVIDRLWEQSTGGMVGATNRLEALTSPVAEDEGSSAAKAPGYVGKKATAKAEADAAVAAGGMFAPRGAPRLAAVNGQPIGQPPGDK